MSRIITVITTQGDQRIELTSSATTWGQLSQEINSNGTFNATGAKALIRGTRQALVSDSDVLPTGDFSLFLTPANIKSGN